MSKNEGIVIAHGVVLKDGLNKFKADKNLVSESLLYVAKISKGLHSGVLNDDPDFSKFQQESMEGLVKKETDKLCDKVVLGAEKMLAKISGTMIAEKAISDEYIYPRHASSTEVEPIFITAAESVKDKSKKTGTEKVQDLIREKGDKLASLNDDEMAYIKEMNKETEKITKIREKVREKILGKIKRDKKVSKNKVSKKKTKKTKKKAGNNIAIKSNKIAIKS